MEVKEQIVLTPKGKTTNTTTLWIERKILENVTSGDKVYVAGGDHHGIIVNKKEDEGGKTVGPAHLSLEFRVYLLNTQNGKQTQEVRTLRFWFRHAIEVDAEHASMAQDFFGDLVHPKDFPKDYVGFIKKIMKLLQHKFYGIVRVELVLHQIEDSQIVERPPSASDDSNSERMVAITEEKIVEIMEFFYPNPITVQDLSREYEWEEKDIRKLLSQLQTKGIIKPVEQGGYTRVTQWDTEIKVVRHMPEMVRAHQPVIAVITAQFTEKLAFDSMMENKETFVRYTTVGLDNDGVRTRFGESNVYTLGNIGNHRIVCTKLPSVGHTREAMTAAGNTTTRLLGTFQNVDHVILVGVGGGVPHFTDYNKHVRLGDVVISHASPKSGGIFISCEGAREVRPGAFVFETKEYLSKNSVLQNIAAQIKVESTINNADEVWKYMDEGLASLQVESEHDFKRPAPESDKLYMAIGERDLIEVTHPTPQGNDTKRLEGRPRLHLGLIGAGREVARSDLFRQKFSQEHHVSSYVSEFDPVIQSIIGNCRDSFLFVRGISDYKDGTKKTEWQSYAALAAAAVTKAIINSLDPLYTQNPMEM